jgi:hypothetical protein
LKHRDFVLVDESHNFRYPDKQRYRVLQALLATGRKCCFLTATPRNKSAWDVYHQIKLFHQDDRTDLPIDPPDLKQYFKLIEKGERKLPDLLVHLLIRRTRNHILRWYGYDAETHEPLDPSRFREYQEGKRKAYVLVGGRHQFFPRRDLATIEYDIEAAYQGLYQELRGYLGKSKRAPGAEPPEAELSYARYGLWHYVVKEKRKLEPYASLHRAGVNLRGLIRILLFKRLESSIYAFRQTVTMLLKVHQRFLDALEQGVVPAGEDAQAILYEPNQAEEQDIVDALREVTGRYRIEDFEIDRLKAHIEHDIGLLKKMLRGVQPITAEQDDKLQTLKRWLNRNPLKEGKRLIFTQYADTAKYLYENLNPNDVQDDIDVIFSGDKSKSRLVGRFAPKANPEYHDLHWNPVRLIQRFGRIDRIGSEHDVVYGFNFLPETGIDRHLGLKDKLHNRIQEIHDSIGEDSYILDGTEQLNEVAMYAIYEGQGGQLELFEDAEGELVDLNEAEETLRLLRRERPDEYERIAKLRDGIRSGRAYKEKGMFVFCQAGRYQQLFLLDGKGGVVSRDIPKVLGALQCGPEAHAEELPKDYNKRVMAVQRKFAEEVKHREAERKYGTSLTQGQRYILREMGVLFRATEDEDVKEQVNTLERAFRQPLTAAVNRELNRLRRNAVVGAALLKSLADVYLQHNMKEWTSRRLEPQAEEYPRIICSEGLV